MFTRPKGFTLIELMIVIAIIAILAAIVVPNFLRARAQSQLSACESNLKNMATALAMYANDHDGEFPNDINELTDSTKQYLREIPLCPSAGAVTYVYFRSPNAIMKRTHGEYILYCKGTNHAAAGISANFPNYCEAKGLLLSSEKVGAPAGTI